VSKSGSLAPADAAESWIGKRDATIPQDDLAEATGTARWVSLAMILLALALWLILAEII